MAPPPSHADGLRAFLIWVWAGLLILGGLGLTALNTGLIHLSSPLFLPAASALALLAVPFVARWLVHRREWWALITAWVFAGMASLLALIALVPVPSQIVGMAALTELAAPFGVAYLANRQRKWALIVAYALLALAALLGLTLFGASPQTFGACGLLAAALPFWAIYLANRANWWAILPAVALSAAGVLLLIALSLLQLSSGALAAILYALLALAAFAVWLTVRRWDWALWLTVAFALAAAAAIWFPVTTGWAIVALVVGLYLAYRQVAALGRRPVPPSPPQAPPSTTVPSSSPAPPTTPPPSATSPPISPEASPLVGFRPLDPYKKRREGDQDAE